MKRSERFAFYISAIAVAGVLQAPLVVSRATAAPAKAPAKAPTNPAPAKAPATVAPAKAPTAPPRTGPIEVAVQPVVAGPVAAEVNNDKVMVADVDRILNSMKEREPSLAIDTEEARATLVTLRQTILDNMITHRLLYQEAQARKIGPTTKEVDDALLDFKNSFRTEAEFNQAMAREGKSAQDVRRMIIEEMSIRKLTHSLTADIKVDDADMQKYYEKNKDDFQVPETVRARHILVLLKPGISATERANLQKRANDLLKKAQGNADFVKLAFDNSDDLGTKRNGGDLNYFAREEMVPPFAEAAFATAPGKVHPKVVESEFGFHIIKVEDKKPSRIMALSELKVVLQPLVLKSKIQDKIDQQIEALRAQATIKKNI